jgi:hypothetical protein
VSIKPPTEKELDVEFGKWWKILPEEGEAEEDKQSIAKQFTVGKKLNDIVEKNKKHNSGNPLLIVKTSEFMQKAASVTGSYHDKSGKYGGTSSYTDKDVAEAYQYMQEVLGVNELSVNGRALEHILAEVYGFALRESANKIKELLAKQGKDTGLEIKVDQYKKANQDLKEIISKLENRLKDAEEAAEKYAQVAKKIEQEPVTEINTGRRIKE